MILRSAQDLVFLVKKIKDSGKVLVVTTGCYDILHYGHVLNLRQAKQFGDFLLVGINSDASVKHHKGSTRPINGERERATVLSELNSVDCVYIFPEHLPTNFVELACPNVYVKGDDYSLEKLKDKEGPILEKQKCKIIFLPLIHGYSTTSLIKKSKEAV